MRLLSFFHSQLGKSSQGLAAHSRCGVSIAPLSLRRTSVLNLRQYFACMIAAMHCRQGVAPCRPVGNGPFDVVRACGPP